MATVVQNPVSTYGPRAKRENDKIKISPEPLQAANSNHRKNAAVLLQAIHVRPLRPKMGQMRTVFMENRIYIHVHFRANSTLI